MSRLPEEVLVWHLRELGVAAGRCLWVGLAAGVFLVPFVLGLLVGVVVAPLLVVGFVVGASVVYVRKEM